jgi:sugar lactone lactonase YvrE
MRELILSDYVSLLGECISYDEALERITYVDILEGKIFAINGTNGISEELANIPYVSSFKLFAPDLYIATALNILFFLDPLGNVLKFETIPFVAQGMRTNDVGIDIFGNIFIGIMWIESSLGSGCICKRSNTGEWSMFIENIGIPNTLTWDYMLHRFYFADSSNGKIMVTSADNCKSPTLRKNDYEVFCDAGILPGLPDGSILDTNGNLWNARWDGGQVAVISPNGEILKQILTSAHRPTSCAFDLQQNLIISTASVGILNPGPTDGKVMSIT